MWLNRPVLITGATGFVGSHLAERLVADGARVRVLVRDPDKLIDALRDRVEVMTGDLLQPDGFVPATRGLDTVFHIAAWLGTPQRVEAAHAINVTATRQLAEAARSNRVRRFIYTSSIAVYGPVMSGAIDETQPHWPVYTYGATKSLGERAALETQMEQSPSFGGTDRFGVTIIRPAMVYGARGSSWTTLPVKLAQRGLPSLVGGGHGLSHPVYVENLIDACLLAAECESAIGEAFTISDGDVPWREFFGRYAAMAGQRARSIPVALAWIGALLAEAAARLTRRPPSISRAQLGFITGRAKLSTAKAQRLLGWSPRFSLDEGLRRTETWLRAAKYLNNEH
jgi:nucleoside-diphosphate-sugar epimerase